MFDCLLFEWWICWDGFFRTRIYRTHLIIFGPHGFKSLKALGPMQGSYWITQAKCPERGREKNMNAFIFGGSVAAPRYSYRHHWIHVSLELLLDSLICPLLCWRNDYRIAMDSISGTAYADKFDVLGIRFSDNRTGVRFFESNRKLCT